MLIAILDLDFAPSDRAEALARLEAQAAAVRALPGNRAFRPLTDPADPGRVTLLHEWDDRAAFDAYLAGPAFAGLGALRALARTPPLSRRFHAEAIETLR